MNTPPGTASARDKTAAPTYARGTGGEPRRWLADNAPWPYIADGTLERATDAQLANWLNLYGWPVRPSWSDDRVGRCEMPPMGPWTGGTHWP